VKAKNFINLGILQKGQNNFCNGDIENRGLLTLELLSGMQWITEVLSKW
jgi:hypothetical protein